MNHERITSAQNPLVKKVAKLGRSASFRKKENLVILDGIHLIQEVIKTDHIQSIEQIFYSSKGGRNHEIKKVMTKTPDNKWIGIPDELLIKIAPTKTPSGILTIYKKPKPNKLTNEKFIILLDHISDPGNMGTIIRTGISMGVEAFFCSPDCVDVWGPKVLRAAQGAHLYTKIFEKFNLKNIKDHFDGKIFGTFLDHKATSLYETDLTGKVGLCFGNEGAGISTDFEQYGDQKIYIPMKNNFESLNVGIAVGICCAEKLRQELP